MVKVRSGSQGAWKQTICKSAKGESSNTCGKGNF